MQIAAPTNARHAGRLNWVRCNTDHPSRVE
jgi:hypothetical protein